MGQMKSSRINSRRRKKVFFLFPDNICFPRTSKCQISPTTRNKILPFLYMIISNNIVSNLWRSFSTVFSISTLIRFSQCFKSITLSNVNCYKNVFVFVGRKVINLLKVHRKVRLHFLIMYLIYIAGVNFTNILRADFWTKVCPKLFCTYILGLNFFWPKNIGAKALTRCWWNWPQERAQKSH